MFYFYFATKIHFFATIAFLLFFFSMKVAESGKIVLGSCIIDMKEFKFRQFRLNLNACKVMVFLKFSGQILKKTIIISIEIQAELS
jgi:hypothetical protein